MGSRHIWGQEESEFENIEPTQENIELMGRNLIYKDNDFVNKNRPQKPIKSMTEKKDIQQRRMYSNQSLNQGGFKNEQITQNFYNQNVIIMQSPQQVSEFGSAGQG